jgi:hypothetical protein
VGCARRSRCSRPKRRHGSADAHGARGAQGRGGIGASSGYTETVPLWSTARRLVALVVALGVIAGAALVSWNRWWRRAGPANPGFACPAVVLARHRVPFAAGGVHRVALIGDSIMEQASCAIADSLAGVGVRTTRHAVPGSGLLAGMDWVTETRKILQAEHPDAVIAIFVGNYVPAPVRDASGRIIVDDSPEFFHVWQYRARLLSAVVHAAHSRMYWVSPPVMDDPVLDHASRLFAGYRTIPGDHVLMSGNVLDGPGGAFVMKKMTCGHERVIRTPEHVHLTADGARLYGQQIAHDFTAGLGVFTTPQPC